MNALRSFLVFLILSVIAGIFHRNLTKFVCENFHNSTDKPSALKATNRRPKYILYTPEPNKATLSAVDDVLQRLGLEKIDTSGLKFSEYPADWDLFWNHDLHVKLRNDIDFRAVKFHQKMNHIPGNYALLSKSVLATQTKLKFVPPAFLTAAATQEYAKLHPEKRFVLKLKSNRGVKLTRPEDMDFVETQTNKNYFAQEFVENPLLWHGHKFDVGIYVVITSVNPLRFYYYTKEVSLRFCPKPYSTDDPEDVGSYVIGNGNLSAQKFRGTRDYVNGSYTYRDAFDGFLKDKGADVDEVWAQIEDMITQVVMTKEKIMAESIAASGTQKLSYFELVRFDMMFTENLELYLLEVNMSPNLHATPTISLLKHSFENILFNMFNLVGIGTTFDQNVINFPNGNVEKMVAHPDGLSIKPEICLSPTCAKNCDDKSCKVCWKCMKKAERIDRILAYREQLNVGEYKRLFPPNKKQFKRLPMELLKELRPDTIHHINWFFEMCKKNRHFC